MKRLVRQLTWVGVALIVVALAFGMTVRALEAPPGPLQRSCDRVRIGMSARQVEAVFGRKSDVLSPHYWIDKGQFWGPPYGQGDGWYGAATRTWKGDEGSVTIWFDLAGKVRETEFVPKKTPNILNRLRALLRW
jgi:hypothetical protein